MIEPARAPDVSLLDPHIEAAALLRQSQLTKPPGSLGALEHLAVKMAAFQANERPQSRPAAALLFAADHPVTKHGVSAYPSAVTAAMVQNFLAGGAASSVMARALFVPLRVVDVGVLNPLPMPSAREGVTYFRHPVASAPVGDLRVEDAMPESTYIAALGAGREAVDGLGSDVRVLLLGEMGIGNTTAAAAVCAALLGVEPAEMVGAGTGVSGPALETKRRVVMDAVSRVSGERDAFRIVQALGGRDIAAMLGAAARAMERKIMVLCDGFVVTAAMLALVRLDASRRDGLLFAHRSHEQAHGRVLAELRASPLLDLSMRLGEASGALAALPLVDLACRLHNEMATFEEASVPNRE